MEAILLANQATTEVTQYLGMELINTEHLLKLLFRFAFNLLFVTIVVRLIYFKTQRRKEYLFTFFLISSTIFLLCFLLDNVKLQLGFALGLFAIFGIIRYRTDAIPIKEMTYLFIVIGLSVINALANKKISYAELVFTNMAIAGSCYLLESFWLLKHETSKSIVYEKIDLIKPENHEQMREDIELRTGLTINRFEIGKVDFLRDVASVRIYYFENKTNG